MQIPGPRLITSQRGTTFCMAKLRSPAHSILFLEPQKTHQHIKGSGKSYQKNKNLPSLVCLFQTCITSDTAKPRFAIPPSDTRRHSSCGLLLMDHFTVRNPSGTLPPAPPKPFILSYLPLSRTLRASKFMSAKSPALFTSKLPR